MLLPYDESSSTTEEPVNNYSIEGHKAPPITEEQLEHEKTIPLKKNNDKQTIGKLSVKFPHLLRLTSRFPRPVSENKGIWKTLSMPPKKLSLTVLLTMVWCLVLMLLSSMAVLWLSPIENIWQGHLLDNTWTQPIAYTLQIPVTITIAAFLGRKLGFITIITFIIAGLIGLPLFSNGGGWHYINAPVFGYILGYLLVSHLVQKESQKAYSSSGWFRGRSLYLLLSGALAVCLVHLSGCTILLLHALGNSLPWQELPNYWTRYTLEPMVYDLVFTLIGLGLVRFFRAIAYFALY